MSPAAPPLALAAALVACTGEAPPEPAEALQNAVLADFGLSLAPAPDRAAHLAWHPPASCTPTFRVRVDETYPDGLERLLNTKAEHSVSFFAVGPRRGAQAMTWPPGPVPEDRVFEGQMVFRGPKTADRPLLRDFALSRRLAGPASPDAPCYERTWDAPEDALALGWPELPGRLTAVGETWRGARVEARCNRAACVDPDTRGGGPQAHLRPCATMSWRETLTGLVELQGPGEPLRAAVIDGLWSDGHALGEGLWSERTALVAVDDGRLLYSHTRIHHTFSGIEREVRVDAVDVCPGGLVAAGWQPDAAVVAARETLAAELPTAKATTPREKTPPKGR